MNKLTCLLNIRKSKIRTSVFPGVKYNIVFCPVNSETPPIILLWDLTQNLTQLWLLIAAVQKGKLPHPSSSCVWKQRLPVTEHQIQIRHSAMSQDGTVSIRFLSSIASTSHTSSQGETRSWKEENMVVQVALANLHTVIFVFAFSRFPWLMKDMGCIPNSSQFQIT